MRKGIYLFTILLLLSSSLLIKPLNTHSSPVKIKEIEQDRKQIKQNLSKKEKEIVNVLGEIEALHEDIVETEKEIAEHNKHIAATEEKVMKYEDEFYDLLDEINELDKLIETRGEILNNRLVSYQEVGGDISYLEVLFNAKSFIDFISRVTSITAVTGADQQIIEQQIEDREEVERLQEEIADKLNAQEELLNDLEETKEQMTEKQANLKQKEKQLKKKEATLKEEKEQLTKKDNNLKRLETTYRERIKAREKERANNVTKVNNTNKPKKKYTVGETIQVVATAYTPNCQGCSGVTSTGINVDNDEHERIIAVDPDVIPLGSQVYVPGYGVATAADTGKDIKGNRIDVLYKSKAQALQWGRRTVTIKILK